MDENVNREDWLLHCYAPEISKEAYWILKANPNVDSVNDPPNIAHTIKNGEHRLVIPLHYKGELKALWINVKEKYTHEELCKAIREELSKF